MPIRLTGLTSGLDTEAIISALVSSYGFKKNKYVKAQTKLAWKQDAWKTLNSKIYSLYKKAGDMKLSSGYTTKKTTCSDTTKATVSAGSSAVNGKQSLNIIKVAQAGYLTGGKLDSSVNSKTTLAELGYTGGDGTIDVTKGDGSTASVTVSQGMTVNGFLDALKGAGVNASFDETNHRIYVSSKETGEASDFSLTGANMDGANALSKLGLNVDSSAASATYKNYTQYYDADGNVIKNNVIDAINAYNAAKEEYATKTAQNGNLSAAYGYGSAYAAMQDTLNSLTGLTDDEKEQFVKLLPMTASGRVNSVMDADGNIYAQSAKDKDGNTIFTYKDDTGAEHLMQREVTYTDDDGNSYTLKSSNKYEDADGNIYTAKKDADGKTVYTAKLADGTEKTVNITTNTDYYEVTSHEVTEKKYSDKSGAEYTYVEDRNGSPVYADADGNEYLANDTGTYYSAATGKTVAISEKEVTTTEYTRTTGTPLVNIEKSSDVLKQLTEKSGLDAAAINTLTTNIKNVNTYESTKDSLDASDPYSRAGIAAAIQAEYRSGGGDAVTALVNTFAEKIASNKTDIEAAEKILEKHKVVAGMDPADNAALDAFVQKVQDAHAITTAGDYNADAKKIDGQDAVIRLNGVEYRNATNEFKINNLSITAQAVTGEKEEDAVQISTETDIQGIYDQVKDFLTQYNTLINEMTSLYGAESSRGYEPLTSEEKEAMTDEEIEKWEDKIKGSLLRRDDTLDSVMSTMVTSMSASFTVNGKSMSLSSLGIHTLGFLNASEHQQNAYHIDGDEDDSSVKSNKDKLMSALQDDPDSVLDFMKQLSTNLYDNMDKKMKSTSMRSIYNVYNDKEMASEYSDYTDMIKKWETKLTEKEDYYYKKFSAMETALTKLQSQTSSLTNMFGS